MLHGVLEVPLVYVICEDGVMDCESFETFTEHCIAKCPFDRLFFEADARTVHQLIESYTTGENSEVWVKKISQENQIPSE